jgi:tetratricopeptide (TPR) repeat protein
LAGLLIFGFDALYARLATLQNPEAFESRWELTLGALRAWWAFPFWGTGLGTFEYVFPKFDSGISPYLAAHADNDYVELLEEMGIFGTACIAMFVVWAGLRIRQLMFHGRTPLAAAAFGICFALTAVAVHSATDFGQHVPANFCLSAVYCGLLAAIVNIDAGAPTKGMSPDLSQPAKWLSRRRVGALTLAIGLLIFWGWALPDTYAAFLGERWWAAAFELQNQMQRGNRAVTDQDYAELIAAADAAAKCEPHDVKYGFWLNEYRWQSLSRVTDPNTGEIVLPPEAIPFVTRIADDLAAVRCLCPTFGPPYALEGELRLFVLKQPIGGDLIRQAVRLASYDFSTCLVAGELAARTERPQEAESLLVRAVQMNPACFREVVGVYLFDLHRLDLAKALASDNYERLTILTSVCGESNEYASSVADLSAAAEQSLRKRAAAVDARPTELATLADADYKRRDFASAAEFYRRALNQDYKQVQWRLQLARALKELGQFDDALHEARICLRIHPRDHEAESLIEDLATRAKSP